MALWKYQWSNWGSLLITDQLWFHTEHEENAGQHPDLYGREPLRLRGVWVDVVEDVDEDEEESDEERHAAGHDVGGDEEADPGHHHEQARGQVVGDDVGGEVTLQSLQSWHRLVRRVINSE